jgi:trehalose/maltose hydrolase-like predicted phosphorylase
MARVENRTKTTRGRKAPASHRLPAALDRRFEAIVFDWDGTAVPDRQTDASRLGKLIEELCALGMELGIVSGGDVGDLDGRLQARPKGPGRLYLCPNRGSEVFLAGEKGVELVYRRQATAAEEAALDAAAEATVADLGRRGLEASVVSRGLNRRKIDLVPDRADPPEAPAAELLKAVEERLRGAALEGLSEAIKLADQQARRAGLADPRLTSDARHLEIGLTDKSDSARWLFQELWGRGIGPGLVAIGDGELRLKGELPGGDSLLLVPEAERAVAFSVGAEPAGAAAGLIELGGGPGRFFDLLADQLERRRRRDVPELDGDPDWTLPVEGLDPKLERVHESRLSLADGFIGTRSTPLLAHPAADPSVLAAGVYASEGADSKLAKCPDWTALEGDLPDEPPLRRVLDLRTGLLRQEGPVTALQLSSLARPGTVALRAQAGADRLPASGSHALTEGGVSVAIGDDREGERLERIGAYRLDRSEARAELTKARKAGYERLLGEHRQAWANRWQEADLVVEGDPDLQLALRFALFHLMASVADEGEAAVGARGLSGSGYNGHVFWDSDVFVLPFLAATHPAAARAMLEYRIRRLDPARETARKLGREGARFPWESAADGYDVTPSHAHLATGELVPIRTGELEEHIVADVAWAAACYLDWTGDEEFAAGPGRELLIETARYWASRIRLDTDGGAHIYGVIGPDEYHEPVDDNAFTNVMARWNLKRGAELLEDGPERRKWLRLARVLVDGYDPMSGLYEQFAGFYKLEPLVIADIAARRPIAADLLLGRERVAGAQVVKQADVLMLHHLLPDEVAPGSLEPNLDFYEPRCAHGSSLSPAVHASLLARAGRFREALPALRIPARIDLDDLTGSTATGVHLATMGGLWQALVFGFAGVRPRADGLRVEPHLPPQWEALELGLRFHGSPLSLRIDRAGVELGAGSEFALRRHNHHWEVTLR